MQSDTVQRAKQGSPGAIAALINQQLQAKCITCQVWWEDDCLKILLESPAVPDKPRYSAYVYKGVKSLGIKAERLQVIGQERGEKLPTWTAEYELTEKSTEVLNLGPDKPVEKTKPSEVKPTVAKLVTTSTPTKPLSRGRQKLIIGSAIGLLITGLAWQSLTSQERGAVIRPNTSTTSK